MPSIGHALGAVGTGWAVAGVASSRKALGIQVAVVAAIGLAPDLDLLIGRHSRETHSVGAALIVATVAAWRRWPIARTPRRIWLTAFCAWLSHPLLDTLALDTTTPQGVMLLWPFMTAHWQTGIALFDPIRREWWEPGFAAHTTMAIFRELMLLAPPTALAWTLRRTRIDQSGYS